MAFAEEKLVELKDLTLLFDANDYKSHPLFKEDIGTGIEIIKTVIAFSKNAGGDIFIGIKDNPREIIGIDEKQLILKEEKLANHLQTVFITLLLVFLATLIAGFTLFFLLTHRLRSLCNAVQAFKQGEFFCRVKIHGNDEISGLGHAFNDMASTIEVNVERLKTSERLRKELIANISHDLRSPLTSIRGYLETVILKDAEFTSAQRREYLGIVLRNVSGFQKLVEELFDLVMLETKQVQPKFEYFQMMDLAQDVVLKLKPRAEKAGVSLAINSPPSLPLLIMLI